MTFKEGHVQFFVSVYSTKAVRTLLAERTLMQNEGVCYDKLHLKIGEFSLMHFQMIHNSIGALPRILAFS